MFSHVMVGAKDLEVLARFYDAVLLPLGLERGPDSVAGPRGICYRAPGTRHPTFDVQEPYDGSPASHGNGSMVAFMAPDRAAVDAAHAAALANGGRDEGAPGPRTRYAPDYYGAYMRDPEGNKLHVVHRGR
ncbi:VOC family protein [Roseomonas sp. SG15]|uniref:VOC family protein n=2 Tax=Roseomonas indoligenes TaxID=2820811 RepID=A0A940MXT7_9PROT|nr:VOC family protein [Pararoseomonas indoligenes]MBP0492789.1 VOC family protein [Pararoseomonas indoligenes]